MGGSAPTIADAARRPRQSGQSGQSAQATPRAPHAAVRADRLCIVLHDLSGGGTERVALRLATAWAARGRHVTLFCGAAEGVLAGLVPPNVVLVEAAPLRRRGIFSRRRLGTALARWLAGDPHDLVFAPGNFHLPVLARFAALAPGAATTVAKISNPLAGRSRGAAIDWVKALAVRRVTRRIDALVAMSPALRGEAQALLAAREVMLAWEPILADRAQFHPQPHSRPRPATGARRRIVAAGRLEAQKDFALALAAFARIAEAEDAELLILGEGRARASLERLAARLGIAERVRMPGHRPAIAGALQAADLLLLSSRFEGYPAVLVEALAAGTPVVATGCSAAIPEILAGCPVSEIAAATPAALAAAMVRVLRRDRPIGGAAANILLARHAVDTAADRYLDMLDRAHARRLARPRACPRLAASGDRA